MKETPEEITSLFPYAYGWSKPRFAFIDRGTVFYKARALSNAGGCKHSVLFPIDIARKTLYVEETWENLSGDAILAVKTGTFRKDTFTSQH